MTDATRPAADERKVCGARRRQCDAHHARKCAVCEPAYCQDRPARGRDRCRRHGGESLRGSAHPSWRHGRRSKFRGDEAKAQLEELLALAARAADEPFDVRRIYGDARVLLEDAIALSTTTGDLGLGIAALNAFATIARARLRIERDPTPVSDRTLPDMYVPRVPRDELQRQVAAQRDAALDELEAFPPPPEKRMVDVDEEAS